MKVLVCCGMGRSGGTLQYQIAAEVVFRLGLGHGVGFGLGMDKLKGKGWLVCKRERPDLASDMAIGIYRDPRDVVCSFMRWRGEQGLYDDFESALRETITAINWFAEWEPLCAHIAQYETFNSVREALAIATLLEKKLDEDAAQEIADLYTIEKNLEMIERIRAEGQWMNPSVMLTAAHIGTGQSVWEETLTKEQVKQVQGCLGSWMRAHGYVCHLDSTGR